MKARRVLSAGVVAISALISLSSTASAVTGYKAFREVSDVTTAGFTQYFDQKLENPWGLAADHNPCYVYGALACHTNAPALPVYPEVTATDTMVNQEATDARKLFWVVANDSDYVLMYDDTGAPLGSGGVQLAIWVQGKPTGIALNPYCEPVRAASATGVTYTSACDHAVPTGSTTLPYAVSSGGLSAPAVWLVAGRDGKVYGWNPNINKNSALPVIDLSATGADLTGLSISPDGSTLALADFHNGKVPLYNSSYTPITLADPLTGPGPLRDPSIPAGYVPSNATFISFPPPADAYPPNFYPPAGSGPQGLHLYVTWGKQGTAYANVPEVVGPPAPTVTYTGVYGYASDFKINTNGTFTVTPFNVPTDKLNAPWAIALAPSIFGVDASTPDAYALYIGNFGDGYLNVFDPATDTYVGRLGENPTQIVPPANTVPGYPTVGSTTPSPTGQVIWLPGLRGLAFKKVAYQVTPVPLVQDWANRLFFNANLQFNATNPANEWSIFGFIRPT